MLASCVRASSTKAASQASAAALHDSKIELATSLHPKNRSIAVTSSNLHKKPSRKKFGTAWQWLPCWRVACVALYKSYIPTLWKPPAWDCVTPLKMRQKGSQNLFFLEETPPQDSAATLQDKSPLDSQAWPSTDHRFCCNACTSVSLAPAIIHNHELRMMQHRILHCTFPPQQVHVRKCRSKGWRQCNCCLTIWSEG